jgi:hypothetical protein
VAVLRDGAKLLNISCGEDPFKGITDVHVTMPGKAIRPEFLNALAQTIASLHLSESDTGTAERPLSPTGNPWRSVRPSQERIRKSWRRSPPASYRRKTCFRSRRLRSEESRYGYGGGKRSHREAGLSSTTASVWFPL